MKLRERIVPPIFASTVAGLLVSGAPTVAQLDFSTAGPFPSQGVVVLDRLTPRELGFTDLPILADLWGWTDPLNGDEYVIVTADAHNVPAPVQGQDLAASVYHPVGGVAFVRLLPDGSLEPLGVWRHPTLAATDHGDVQVYADRAYVTGEAPGYGLVVFDLTKLRGRAPCGSPEDCAGALSDLPGFALIRTGFTDASGHAVSFSDGHNLTIDEATGFMAIHAANTEENADKPNARRARSTKVLRIDPSAPDDPLLLEDLERASHDGLIIRYHGPDEQHQGKLLLLLANGYKHQFVAANETEVENNPKNGPAIYQLTEADGETVDIKKLSLPVTYADDDFGHQLALSEDQRFIFFNDEAQFPDSVTGRQIVFDISELKKPLELFQCFYPVQTVTHDGYVRGDLLFSSTYSSGLRVVDVGDVETTLCHDGLLNEVAFIDTEPRLDGFADVLTFDAGSGVVLQASSLYAGSWGNYPYFPSGRIVMSDFFNGVFSLELEQP